MWEFAGWTGLVLPAVLVAVWVRLWWRRRASMAWFFGGALAVTVASCPAGYVVEMLLPRACAPSNGARIPPASDHWGNFCFPERSMVIWANTYYAAITIGLLAVATLVVLAAQRFLAGSARSAQVEDRDGLGR